MSMLEVVWKIISFVLHFLLFLAVSAVFLPLLAVAYFGTPIYEKWWEKISSF